jgi:hypothetical protein
MIKVGVGFTAECDDCSSACGPVFESRAELVEYLQTNRWTLILRDDFRAVLCCRACAQAARRAESGDAKPGR